MRLSSASILWLLGILLVCAPGRADAPSRDRGAAAVEERDARRAAGVIAWRRLLHYRVLVNGRVRSQIDNRDFFLAATGQEDPNAELQATLAAFRRPVDAERADEHALCRFPARREVLRRLLGPDAVPDAPNCPALARFLAELDPTEVAVVYAANYLENPASAFGHTFLRLKKRRAAGSVPSARDDERDHGIEYTAEVDTHNPFLYVFKGLTGLFDGVYRFHSFESKLHEYANAEARDLWEYTLSLTQPEVELLTLHLWELARAKLDYYYLTKNCAYHTLATLEAIAPRIDVIAHTKFVVIPRDTVQALFSVPGLVRASVYRPSLRSQFRRQVAQLNDEERGAVELLALEPDAPLAAGLSVERKVAVLDVAKLVVEARFSRELEMADGERPDPRVVAALEILTRRREALSRTQALPPPGPAPLDKAPELAHGSMRLTLGSGLTTQYDAPFYTLGYRLALHDLTDPPDGEPELSQLQFLDTRLRYDLGTRALTVDRFTFAELLSLSPLTRYERSWSWRIRAFGTRLHDSGCSDCFAHGLEIGLGGTVATADGRLALFSLADGYVAFSGELDGVDGSFVRLGAGPLLGLRARPFRRVMGLLTAQLSYLPWQPARTTYDLRATLRGEIAHDVAFGFEAAAQPESSEALFASYLYF